MKKYFNISLLFLLFSATSFGQNIDTLSFGEYADTITSMDSIHSKISGKIYARTYIRHRTVPFIKYGRYLSADEITFPIHFNAIDCIMGKTDQIWMRYNTPNFIDTIYLNDCAIGDTFFLHQILEWNKQKFEIKSTMFHRNGNISAQVEYKVPIDTTNKSHPPISLKKMGHFTSYHPNGQIAIMTAMKDNLATGPYYSFYENGQVKEQTNMKRGYHDGPYESFYETGEIKEISEWEAGFGVGEQKIWHKNGQLKASLTHEKLLAHGLKKEWYEDGQLAYEAEVFYGTLINTETAYYKNGKIKYRTKYKLNTRPETIESIKQEYFENYNNRNSQAHIVTTNNGKIPIPVTRTHYDGLDRSLLSAFERNAYRRKYQSFKLQKEAFTETGKKILVETYTKNTWLHRLFPKPFDRFSNDNYTNDTLGTVQEIKHFFAQDNQCDNEITLFLNDVYPSYKRTFCLENVIDVQIDTVEYDYQRYLLDSISKITEIVKFERSKGMCTYQRFYPNGQMQLEYFYNNIDFSSNARYNLHNTGTWHFWYPNGQLKYEIEWEDTIWNRFRNNVFEKRSIEYYENGQLKRITQYADEWMQATKTYYKNGNIESEGYFKPIGNQDFPYRSWRKNGELKKEWAYSPTEHEVYY